MNLRQLSTLIALMAFLPVAGDEFDQVKVDATAKKVSSQGAKLLPIAKHAPQFLRVLASESFTDESLAALEPVAEHILWLDLASSNVSDSGLLKLSVFKNLTRLSLENTNISDSSIDTIANLKNLEYLNLHSTNITDVSLNKLANSKKLEKLFIWKTETSEQGIAKLAKALPELDINVGWKPATSSTPTNKPATVTNDTGSALNSALTELSTAVENAKRKTDSAKAAHARALAKAAEATEYANSLKLEVDQAAAIESKAITALEELKKAIQATGLNN